jgi:RNA polymerase sigma-70 factor (ECF subfamily)
MSRSDEMFSKLMAHHAAVYRHVLWLSGSRAIAEDVTQEVYLRAWRAMAKIEKDQAHKAWLLTIARHEYFRYRQRNREFASIDAEDLGHATVVAIGDRAAREDLDGSLDLRAMLLKLPVRFREPLLLQTVHGYSLDEIALIMGIPANTAATRIFRARRLIKEMMEQSEGRARRQSDAMS